MLELNVKEQKHEVLIYQGDVVIDLGGYRGDWSAMLLDAAPIDFTLHIFEPIAEYAAQIQERFAKDSRAQLHTLAASTFYGMIPMTVAGDGSTSHRGEPDRLVDCTDFVDFLAKHCPQGVKLLKMNVEGEEFALLEHLIGSGAIKTVESLLIQFHSDTDLASNYQSVRLVLSETHTGPETEDWTWEIWVRRSDEEDTKSVQA